MVLRLAIIEKELKVCCSNGSFLNANEGVLRKILTGFDKANQIKGNDGYWSNTYSNMMDIPGQTLAYVSDDLKLVVLDKDVFKSIVTPTNYISVNEFAEKHGKQIAIVRRLCAEGRIENTQKIGETWLIPSDAKYPERKPRTIKSKKE